VLVTRLAHAQERFGDLSLEGLDPGAGRFVEQLDTERGHPLVRTETHRVTFISRPSRGRGLARAGNPHRTITVGLRPSFGLPAATPTACIAREDGPVLLLGGLAAIMLCAIVIPVLTSWFANTTLPPEARSGRTTAFFDRFFRRGRRPSL